MSNYEAPAELRGLETGLRKLCANGEHEMSRVFEDWLRFIVANFTLNIEPDPTWQYTREEDKKFHALMVEWFCVMKRETYTKKWYDAFGELYMSLIASKSTQQGHGQFFSPPNICDLMQAILKPAKKIEREIIVSDPTCGSGRLLLAYHVENLGNYLIAEDISQVCCLMTVCNFLIHGCKGEVIWHDSLDPNSWYGGWAVQGATLKLPLPHVMKIDASQSVLMKSWEDRKKNESTPQPKIIRIAKPVQLDLFSF